MGSGGAPATPGSTVYLRGCDNRNGDWRASIVPVGLIPLKLAARRLGERGVRVRRGGIVEVGDGSGR